jgi:hypothetical protein
MKEGTQLTQPQRKALVDMLGMGYSDVIWSRARSKYEEIRSDLFDSFIREAAEKNQSTQDIIATIFRLKAAERKVETILQNAKVDLAEAQGKLKAFGFRLSDGGNLSLSSDCPDALKQSIDKRVDKELGTREQVLEIPFEIARLKLLTVATSEEAEKLVEPLLNFEVKAA